MDAARRLLGAHADPDLVEELIEDLEDTIPADDLPAFMTFAEAYRLPEADSDRPLNLFRKLMEVPSERRDLFREIFPTAEPLNSFDIDDVKMRCSACRDLTDLLGDAKLQPRQANWLMTALAGLPWGKGRLSMKDGYEVTLEIETAGKAILKIFSSKPEGEWPELAAHLNALNQPDKSLDDMASLTRWLAELTPGEREVIPRADIPPMDEAAVPDVETAVFRAAMAPCPRADPRPWRTCIESAASAQEMQAPWDTLPARFLVPHRGEVARLIEAKHPAAVSACRRKGGFDGQSKEHQLVDWYRQLHTGHLYKFLTLYPDFSYQDVQKVLHKDQEIRAGRVKGELSRQAYLNRAARTDAAGAIYSGYQAHVFKTEVLHRLRARMAELARQSGKPAARHIDEVHNVTSGASELSGNDHHKYGGISTKQGSSDLQSDPHAFNPELFTLEYWRETFARGELPLIVVADSTTSLQNRTNRRPMFPEAFQGYRNIAAVVNQATGVDPYPQWRARGLDDTPLRLYPEHQRFFDMLEELARENPGAKELFDLHYLSQTEQSLDIRRKGEGPFDKSTLRRAPPFEDAQVLGPGMALVQVCMTHEDIQRRAEAGEPAAILALSRAEEARAEQLKDPAMQQQLLNAYPEAKGNAEWLKQAIHIPAIFDDDNYAQNPVLYISRSGRIMIKPPMHRFASDFQKEIDDLGRGDEASREGKSASPEPGSH